MRGQSIECFSALWSLLSAEAQGGLAKAGCCARTVHTWPGESHPAGRSRCRLCQVQALLPDWSASRGGRDLRPRACVLSPQWEGAMASSGRTSSPQPLPSFSGSRVQSFPSPGGFSAGPWVPSSQKLSVEPCLAVWWGQAGLSSSADSGLLGDLMQSTQGLCCGHPSSQWRIWIFM